MEFCTRFGGLSGVNQVAFIGACFTHLIFAFIRGEVVRKLLPCVRLLWMIKFVIVVAFCLLFKDHLLFPSARWGGVVFKTPRAREGSVIVVWLIFIVPSLFLFKLVLDVDVQLQMFIFIRFILKVRLIKTTRADSLYAAGAIGVWLTRSLRDADCMKLFGVIIASWAKGLEIRFLIVFIIDLLEFGCQFKILWFSCFSQSVFVRFCHFIFLYDYIVVDFHSFVFQEDLFFLTHLTYVSDHYAAVDCLLGVWASYYGRQERTPSRALSLATYTVSLCLRDGQIYFLTFRNFSVPVVGFDV